MISTEYTFDNSFKKYLSSIERNFKHDYIIKICSIKEIHDNCNYYYNLVIFVNDKRSLVFLDARGVVEKYEEIPHQELSKIELINILKSNIQYYDMIKKDIYKQLIEKKLDELLSEGKTKSNKRMKL